MFTVTPLFVITALAIVWVLEGGAAALFMWLTRNPFKLVLYVLAINAVTVTAGWILLPLILPGELSIVGYFAFAVIVEFAVLAYLFRQTLKVYETLGFVLALNIFSTVVGMLVMMTLSVVFSS
jgi:hypothetical protein